MPRLKTKGQSRCWEASRVGEEAKQREEKHSDFCTGSPARLLPGPDKRVAVPRARPRSWPRNQALGPPPSAWPSLVHFPWASSSAASGSRCSRAAKNKGLVRIQPEKPVYRNTLSTDADAEPEQSFPKDHRRTKCNLLGTEFDQTFILGDKLQLEAAQC